MVDKFKSSNGFGGDDGLDFNFDNIDVDFGQVKDDRSPTTKIKDSALSAAKDHAKNPSTIAKYIRGAMPDAYGEAFDIIRESNTEIQGLYNSVKDKTAPMVEKTKGLVRTALPSAKGVLPQALYKKIEAATKEKESYRYGEVNQEEADNARVEALLGDIFKATTELDKQRDERQEYKETLAQGIEQERHKDVLSLIDDIRKNISSQTQYQNKITSPYQKKSLELKYRHYWVAVDSYKTQKETSKKLLEMTAAIQKNTGLPDYAKLRNVEAFVEQGRNKFITDVRDSMFGDVSGYVRQMGANAKKQAGSFIDNVRMGFDATEGMASSAIGQMSQADSYGSSAGEEMAAMATPEAMDEIARRLGNSGRKWLTKNKSVNRLGQHVTRATSSMPDMIEKGLTDGKYNAGIFEPLRMMMASLLPNGKADTQMEFTAIKDLNRPAQVTGMDLKTSREVIPGLLARIHREIRIMRTGDTSTPLIAYDFERNRFSNDKEIGKSLRQRFGNSEQTTKGLDEMIDRIDPKGTLTTEQRQELRKELIGKVYDQKSTSFEKLSQSGNWSGANAETFSGLFKSYGHIGPDGKMGVNAGTNKRQNWFTKNLRSTVAANGDPRIFIQEMISMGQYDMLLRSGMMDETGRINLKAVKEYLSGGDVQGIGDLDDINTTGVGNSGGFGGSTTVNNNADFSGLEKALNANTARQRSGTGGAARTNFQSTEITEPLASIGATLARIEEILLNTDNTTSMTYQFTTGDTEGGKSYTSLLEHMGDKISGAAKSIGAKAKSVGGTAWDIGKFGGRKAKVLGKLFGRKAKNAGRYAKNKMLGFLENDIFVGNEAKARLHAAVFKAGGYFDSATGKVITDFSKLKGDVKDAQGRVVLRLEEIGDAYEAGTWGRKLSEIIGSGWDKLRDAGDFLKDFIPGAISNTIGLAKKAYSYAYGKLPPYDVYVKGDDKPVLYATMFKLGRYRDKESGKVLSHPRDITGEVIDREDNVVLSEEQLKTGLVDIRGGKVGNPLSRIYARTAGSVVNAFNLVKDIGSASFKWISGKVKDSAAFIKNLITGRIEIGVYAKRTSDILEEIRDFMFDKWGGRKRVIGDSNGDGIRDNSLQDKESRKNTTTSTTEDPSKEGNEKGIMGRVASMFASARDRFSKKNKDDDDEEDEDDDGWGLDEAADIADIADVADEANERRKGGKDGKGKKKRSRSRTRRARRRLKRMKVPKGKMPNMSLPKSTGGISNIAKKGMFNSAMPRFLAKLGLGGLAATAAGASGGIAAAGAAGTALGYAGTALGFLASWPVTIGIGAVGLGIYAYEKSKETKITPLSTVRLAQYGFKADDVETAKKVFALEQLLQEHVVYDSEGWASVDRNKAEAKKLAEIFGITTAAQAARFLKWYDGRFYPVFTNALSKMKKLKVSKPDLSTIETQLEPNVKESYMDDLVSACESAHNKMFGPPPTLRLTVNNDEVLSIANQQRLVIKRMEKNETGKTASTVTPEEAAGGVKTSNSEMARRIADDFTNYDVKDRDGNVVNDLSAENVRKVLADGGSYKVKVSVPDNVLLSDPTRLDALSCIRFKTYGLRTMQLDKVQAIIALENFCVKYVTVNGPIANFTLSTNEAIMKAGAIFGKHNTTGNASREWKQWFSERFLPVFLPFVAAIQNLTNSKDAFKAAATLTPSQQLKVANMLTGQASINNQRIAADVWLATSSPWVDYMVNTNPDSVIGNLETIKVLVSRIELKEPLDKRASLGKEPGQTEEDLTKAAFVYGTGKSKSAFRGGANADNAQMKASGDFLQKSGDVMQRMGDPARLSTGSGKRWQDIPHSTGAGWAANKDLIIAAALATGVNPKDLAAYIGVESGFDPAARAFGGGKALGLGQFMPGTWAEMMKKHGASLGIPAGTPRTDARANALLTAMYLKDNLGILKKTLGRDPSVVEGYLAHFAGATGASSLLDAGGDAIAAKVRPAAAANNPNIFYDPSTKRAYTVKEMLAAMEHKLTHKPGDFGVRADDFTGTAMASTASSGSSSAGSASAAPTTPGGQGAEASGANQVRVAPNGFGNNSAAMAGNNRERQETTLRPAVETDLSVKANTEATKMPIKPGQALELTLRREPSTEDGTFGVLQLPDGSSFLTLELPWLNNQQAVSCIPPGTYSCAKRQTTKHGFAYEVKSVPGRSGILIHAGATAGDTRTGKKADSQGCILLGLGRNTRKNGQKGITDTKAAMKAFYDKLQDLPFKLTVLAGQGDEASVEKNTETAKSINIMQNAAPPPVNAPVVNTGATSQGGLRGAVAAARGNQITTPGAIPTNQSQSDPAYSEMARVSKGFKPTGTEMTARNATLMEVLTKTSSDTIDVLNQNLAANNRTAAAAEELVKLMGSNTPTGAASQPAVTPKVTRTPTTAPTPAVSMGKT